MEYLANPFNLSVNPFSNEGICGILNIASINLFYYILSTCICKLSEIDEQETCIEDDTNIDEIPDIVYDNVFNDESVDNKTKKDLISLLDINSLERSYILYYIFCKKGYFDNGELQINTFKYFKKVANDLQNILSIDDNDVDLVINLDENLDHNYQTVIDNSFIDCNIAHIRFLSWLYYSGIYDYLINDDNKMQATLEDMNNRKLLIGNLFLKYQLYLIEIENKTETCDIKECETEESNNENLVDYDDDGDDKQDNLTDVDTDADVDVDVDAITDTIDNDLDNEKELKANTNYQDLSDMNNSSFLIKLLSILGNLGMKSLIIIWNSVKEDIAEIFHPILGG